ncbi:MAG: D-mannonate dehydratase [Acidobacteria bacterium]|nr:D-mannonate dehydratase [Acidobacteriota bacterium]
MIRPDMRATRRFLLQLPLAAAASAAAWITEADPGNIKLVRRLPAEISDDDLLFLKQIGLRWARVEFPRERARFDDLVAAQKRYAAYGMKIHSVVHPAYREIDLQLRRQPGCDRYIAEYQQFLRDLGKLGMPVASYDFHPANTYTTAIVESPRGYKTREFRLNDFREKVEKQKFDREYPVEEIWSNYEYFMKATLPVAAEAGVRMALHPDDPPLAMMNGVGKMFVHYDGYARAERIAEAIEGKGAPHWGLTFCVGTWSEGGDRMGKNVFEMIEDFGGRGKLCEIHYRGVSSPLPNFTETFQDEGYLDLYEVMKALRKVKFSGAVMPDHVPRLEGDSGINRAGTAYCIAWMRATLARANAEVG